MARRGHLFASKWVIFEKKSGGDVKNRLFASFYDVNKIGVLAKKRK